ncbi:MAG: hypothetical protein NVS4B12_28110 [Ktedonobacteraceae bacterium]
MNSVLCRATDTGVNEYMLQSDRERMNTTLEESYATAPMATVRPTSISEEELHTLFEAAISSRLLAMREQMQRISGPLLYHQQFRYETDALPVLETQPQKTPLFRHNWQRIMLFSSLSLMLTLMGFDLMGLLVLYMR